MSSLKKNDRRVHKTRKAIQDGFSELMISKELKNITVKELAAKVDINRGTFYKHYYDLYDLYEKMEDAVFNELSAIIVSNPFQVYEVMFRDIVDYVGKSPLISQMFLAKNGGSCFLSRLSKFLEAKCLEIWLYDTKRKQIPEEWKFIAPYYVQGSIAIVRRWAESNFVYPKEEIFKTILRAWYEKRPWR